MSDKLRRDSIKNSVKILDGKKAKVEILNCPGIVFSEAYTNEPLQMAVLEDRIEFYNDGSKLYYGSSPVKTKFVPQDIANKLKDKIEVDYDQKDEIEKEIAHYFKGQKQLVFCFYFNSIYKVNIEYDEENENLKSVQLDNAILYISNS